MDFDLETKRFLEGVAQNLRNGQMKPPLRFYLDKQAIPKGPTLYHFRWDGANEMGTSQVEGMAGKQWVDALVAGKFVTPRGQLRYEINYEQVAAWYARENPATQE